jgi:hypothetical protein
MNRQKVIKELISVFVLFVLILYNLTGQGTAKLNNYSIDITVPGKIIISNQLKLGGTNTGNDT